MTQDRRFESLLWEHLKEAGIPHTSFVMRDGLGHYLPIKTQAEVQDSVNDDRYHN